MGEGSTLVMIRGRRFPKIFPPGSGFKKGQGKEWGKKIKEEKRRENTRDRGEKERQRSRITNRLMTMRDWRRPAEQDDRQTDGQTERKKNESKEGGLARWSPVEAGLEHLQRYIYPADSQSHDVGFWVIRGRGDFHWKLDSGTTVVPVNP